MSLLLVEFRESRDVMLKLKWLFISLNIHAYPIRKVSAERNNQRSLEVFINGRSYRHYWATLYRTLLVEAVHYPDQGSWWLMKRLRMTGYVGDETSQSQPGVAEKYIGYGQYFLLGSILWNNQNFSHDTTSGHDIINVRMNNPETSVCCDNC